MVEQACLVGGLYLACAAGARVLVNRGVRAGKLSFPLVTVLLAVAIAVPSTLQLLFPEILAVCERDYARLLSGDWWRLITPLFVQDGGVGGAVSNLVGLLVVGGIAEQLWGRWRMLAIFFIGGLVGELVGLAWQPTGAGNSVGNFSLAGSIVWLCLAPAQEKLTRMIASLALGADVVLVALKDIHGAAAVAGLTLALVVGMLRAESSL